MVHASVEYIDILKNLQDERKLDPTPVPEFPRAQGWTQLRGGQDIFYVSRNPPGFSGTKLER